MQKLSIYFESQKYLSFKQISYDALDTDYFLILKNNFDAHLKRL